MLLIMEKPFKHALTLNTTYAPMGNKPVSYLIWKQWFCFHSSVFCFTNNDRQLVTKEMGGI